MEGWLCGQADALGACAAVVALLSDDGTALEPRWSIGYPEEVVHSWRRIEVSERTPLVDALHGEPVIIGSVAELEARYPLMAVRPTSGFACCVAVAVPGRAGRPVGVLGLSFTELEPELTPARARRAASQLARHLRGGTEREGGEHDQGDRRAQASEAALHRLRQLTALTGRLAAAVDADEVASVVADLARSALRADAATLTAYDGHSAAVPLAASGLTGPRWDPRSAGPRDHVPFERLALVREIVRTRHPVLVTSRADRDARYPDMAGNGVVQEAWANLPLVLADRLVGVAAFGWDAPRRFSADDVDFLQALADHAAIALDRVAALATSRSLAESMQRSLLPAALPDMPRFAFAARYLPATHGLPIGGDWYDVLELTPDRVAVVVGDVVGHGANAAAVMGQLRSALTSCLLDGYGPAQALEHLDRFARRVPGARVSSAACLLVDADDEALVWASAGHPPPLLLGPDGSRYLFAAGGPVLGVVPSPSHVEHSARLPTGATVLLYTDGLVERRGESLDTGFARLAATAESLRHLPPAQLLDGVRARLRDHDGPVDDIAVVAAMPLTV